MSIDAIKRLAAQKNAVSLAETSTDCAWCGQAIPEPRRQAVPGCDLCLRCQSEKERLK